MQRLLGLFLFLAVLREAGAACEQCLNGEVCTSGSTCQCDTSKYNNATLSDLKPNVTCQGPAMAISVNKCVLEAFRYDSSASYLSNTNCTNANIQVENNEHVYTFKAQNRSCIQNVTKSDNQATVWNVLYLIPNKTGIVTANPYNISFSCVYNLTMLLSLAFALRPIMSTVTLNSGGSGESTVTMGVYSNPGYTEPVQEEQVVPMGSQLYFGMTSTFADGETFALKAENCFAVPVKDPNSPQKVDLLINGCPAKQNVNIQVVENGVSLQTRFSVNTFAFANSPYVYIYCSGRLCLKKTSDCGDCTAGGTKRSTEGGSVSIGVGPINLSGNVATDSGFSTAFSWSLMAGSLFSLKMMG